jgi:hypothetical protein
MRCSRAQKLIPFFINGELQEQQRRNVDEHLRRCDACKKMADEYAALSRLAQSAPTPVEPEGFYDNFYDEVMARIDRSSKPSKRSPAKKFAWPVIRPRLAFAGIGVAIAVAVFALFSTIKNDAPRVTLETYLTQRNFTELARAIADDRQRSMLFSDSVSVDLMIASLKTLDRINAGNGQVAQYLTPVMTMLQQELSKQQAETTENAERRVGPKVLKAGMFAGAFDFKKAIRALRMINRPGIKITLIDLAKYLPDFHRQARI